MSSHVIYRCDECGAETMGPYLSIKQMAGQKHKYRVGVGVEVVGKRGMGDIQIGELCPKCIQPHLPQPPKQEEKTDD